MSATPVHEDASVFARRAAERAGVEIRPLDGVAEFEAGSALVCRIWDDADPKAPVNLLRALSHAGNFVAGAFADGTLVGISIGFFGADGGGFHLHSHITGVDPAFQGRSVGFALKQFQRSWALERGASTIHWTTDPLVRRNLFFNLVKLGATVVAYHDDFYGQILDGVNGSDASDRVVVRWELDSERAATAASGTVELPAGSGGSVLLRTDTAGKPEVCAADGDTLLVWVPDDIVAMRAHAPEVAHAWRLALRETAGRLLSDGYRAETITRDGWCVFAR